MGSRGQSYLLVDFHRPDNSPLYRMLIRISLVLFTTKKPSYEQDD